MSIVGFVGLHTRLVMVIGREVGQEEMWEMRKSRKMDIYRGKLLIYIDGDAEKTVFSCLNIGEIEDVGLMYISFSHTFPYCYAKLRLIPIEMSLF